MSREGEWGIARWRALGTTAEVIVTVPPELPAARHAVAGVLERIGLAASRFRPDSELSRLNRSGGAWQRVTPLFAMALEAGYDAAVWTQGLLDPTVGRSLIDLGYDRTFRDVRPIGPALSVRIAPAAGADSIELDAARSRVRVAPGVLLDLGATAKALAADLAAAAALDAGVTGGVLVNLGGDIAVAGSSPPAGVAGPGN